MEFLGLLVDSSSIKFYLPPPKVTKTTQLCYSLLQRNPVSLRRLAQLLGFLESTRPAIWLAPLHFRHLQNRLIQQVTLNKGSYEGLVFLEPLAQRELQWWISNIQQINGSLIHPPTYELTITSDASKLGWGGGGHMRPPYSQGQLVRAGAFNAHQHIRTQSSLSDNQYIPETQDKHVNKVKARQYNRSRVHKQQRGDTFPKLNNVVNGAVELVCQPKYLHTGRTLASSSELPSGQRIENVCRFERLENSPEPHQEVPSGQRHRPLCNQTDTPAPTLCELASRPTRVRNRCIYSKLGHFERLRLPPPPPPPPPPPSTSYREH